MWHNGDLAEAIKRAHEAAFRELRTSPEQWNQALTEFINDVKDDE